MAQGTQPTAGSRLTVCPVCGRTFTDFEEFDSGEADFVHGPRRVCRASREDMERLHAAVSDAVYRDWVARWRRLYV